MPTTKCPLCDSPCIVKIVIEGNKTYDEVDVCKMCGTMYPRGRTVTRASSTRSAKPAKGKAPRKK